MRGLRVAGAATLGVEADRADRVELDRVALAAMGDDDRDLGADLDALDAIDDQRLLADVEVDGDRQPGGHHEGVAVALEAAAAEDVEQVLVEHGGGSLARIAAAGVLAIWLGCGGGGAARAPRGPSEATRAAVARAEAHERARRHDLARAEYERAVAAAPDPASEVFARLELASMLAFWGEVGAAITELEAVVALAPRHARAWHDLGVLRHNQGDDPGATTALERAVALAPRDPRPRIALAALLWQRGDRMGARAQYETLLEMELPERVREKVEWALEQLR